MSNELRQLIRELLQEQLQALGQHKNVLTLPATDNTSTAAPPHKAAKVEFVSVGNDQDLAEFVAYVLKLNADPVTHQALHSGQIIFRIAPASNNPIPADNHSVPAKADKTEAVARYEHGLLTERECDSFDQRITSLQIGKSVRITPLAADNLRRRGVSIHRAES